MKKKLKIFGIILGILILAYAGFKLFLGPDGFVKEEELVESYITNLTAADSCEKHFNEETQSVCSVFVSNLRNAEVSVVSIDVNNDQATVMLDINGYEQPFTFVFISEEVTGIKGNVYSNYYLIDYMN